MLIMRLYGLYHYLFIWIEINKKLNALLKTRMVVMQFRHMANNTTTGTNMTETNTTETNAGNPPVTIWKVSYKHHTNFAMESIEQTFNGQADFGTTETMATAITETATTMATTETNNASLSQIEPAKFGKIQHTYRPIPQGFMGYGSSGAWD